MSALLYLPFDELDVLCINKNFLETERNYALKPLWSVQNDSECYRFEIYYKDTSPRYKCHICDLQVPVMYAEDHELSRRHSICLEVMKIALERTKCHLQPKSKAEVKIPMQTYYCEVCSLTVLLEHKVAHNSTKQHMRNLKTEEQLKKLLYLYANKEDSCSNLDQDQFSYSGNTVNLLLGSEQLDIHKNTINNHTEKPTPKQEKELDPIANIAICKNTNVLDDEKQKNGCKNKNLIEIELHDGSGVQLYEENYQAIITMDKETYCIVCFEYISDYHAHIMSQNHLANISAPIDGNGLRQINENLNHCVLCNLWVDAKKHKVDPYHLAKLNKAKDVYATTSKQHSSISNIDIYRNFHENNRDHTTVQRDKVTGDHTTAQRDKVTSDHTTAQRDKVTSDHGTEKDDKLTSDHVIVQRDKVTGDHATVKHDKVTGDHATVQRDKVTGDHTTAQRDKVTGDHTTAQRDKVTGDHATVQRDKVTSDHTTAQRDKVTGDHTTAQRDKVTGDHATVQRDKVTGDHTTAQRDKVTADYATVKHDKVLGDHTTAQRDKVTGDYTTVKHDKVSGDHTISLHDKVTSDHATEKDDKDTGDHTTVQLDKVTGDHTTAQRDKVTGDYATVKHDKVSGDHTISLRDKVTSDHATEKDDKDTGDHMTVQRDKVTGDHTTAQRDKVTGDYATVKHDKVSGDHTISLRDKVTSDHATEKFDKDTGDHTTVQRDKVTGDHTTAQRDKVTGDYATAQRDNQFCGICKVNFVKNMKTHVKSMKHKMNVKRVNYQIIKINDELHCRVCEEPIADADTHFASQAHLNRYEDLIRQNSLVSTADGRMKCALCKHNFVESFVLYHIARRTHKWKVQKVKNDQIDQRLSTNDLTKPESVTTNAIFESFQTISSTIC